MTTHPVKPRNGGSPARSRTAEAERPAGEGAAAGRAFWSGVISFGLVSVPVNLFPANRPSGVSLRMLDEDGTPLARRYYCPEEDRALDRDEIVRGREVESGKFVVVTDDELEALEPKKSREIDLVRFVDRDSIDPRWFQRGYFLTPAGESTKAYRLLARAMESTGRAGVATFVMRGKEYLVVLLADGGILRAETLRFHDEVRTPDDVGLPERPRTAAKRVREIEKEIEALAAGEIDPAELEDEDAGRLLDLVEAKTREGRDLVEVPSARAEDEGDEGGRVIDLMEVLKQSLAGAGKAKRPASRRGGGLDSRSRSELYRRAQELDIPGRSTMTKDQLIEAIRKTG